jgi:[acyl-carrier-protein] S-malonyltransferase
MTIGFFVSRAAEELDEGSAAFYERFPSVRRLYSDVQEWTGLSPDQLLSGDLPDAHGLRNSILAIRSIAGQAAVHDVLAESGVKPDAVLALSLGITSASSMIGSIAREQMFRMLWHRRNIPDLPPTAPAQGVALCVVQPDQDPSWFYVGRDGVYLAVDFGETTDDSRWVVLTGYKAALQELAAQEPDAVMMMERGTAAVHSPLRRHASDFVREHVATMDVRDPRVPLAACLGRQVLTSADEVRDAIWRNLVVTASIPDGLSAVLGLGVKILVIPGPSMADDMINFRVPVVRVRRPDDVEPAVSAVRDALEDAENEVGGPVVASLAQP